MTRQNLHLSALVSMGEEVHLSANREAGGYSEVSGFLEQAAVLLAKQEPLGRDFEQVLYANLWDLYVRS